MPELPPYKVVSLYDLRDPDGYCSNPSKALEKQLNRLAEAGYRLGGIVPGDSHYHPMVIMELDTDAEPAFSLTPEAQALKFLAETPETE